MREIPIVAIRGSVVFPHTDSILSFGRKKSVAAINAAFEGDRIVAIFTQKDARMTDPAADGLYTVGVIATISQKMSTESEIHVVVKGQARVKLQKITTQNPFLVGDVIELPEVEYSGDEVMAISRSLSEMFKKAINLGKGVEITTVMKLISGFVGPNELVDNVASLLDIKTEAKQSLLEELSVKARLKKVSDLMAQEINVLDLERTLTTKTQKRFEEQMRKNMLRERKRTIEKELGEDDSEDNKSEVEELTDKIKKARMPKEVAARAKKELKKLSRMSPHNPESGYLRNYLDWLIEVPWHKSSKTKVSIARAVKILDQDHFALEKAKERIIEFLAVMKVKEQNGKAKKKKKRNGDDGHPTILCFVGPPGVGKTSIGKSIAKALGRKFVRVSLGGIRDEAEIRGHRRTYIGALPGRIIQGIKDAGTVNPVFMLDEVDKIGTDFRGDPSSALLEALDPEQNREFSDHYLEVPYDLSQVMFICTANITDTIPSPLLDRMEVIGFPGYIETEKVAIARKYLWPKQLRAHGLEDKKIVLEKEALIEIIKRYTREAGVRNLERSLATVCRKLVRQVAEGKKIKSQVSLSSIGKYLGPRKFTSTIAEKKDEVGMSTGLAYTPAGGDIIFIETALMPGQGKLTLTGQLGDVMKESAKAAFTWTKSNWRLLGLAEDFGSKLDVHIHVPEGAIPKDGPSAGVSIATSLVSALTKIPVKREVGMTGELTLRGRVLEIGGVKEKTIAAHTAGLKKLVLPKDNKKNLIDVPQNIKKDIKFVHADMLEDVLKVAMKHWPPKRQVRMSRPLPRVPAYLTVN
ncbi:endopeptidase La [Candidatus Woesebacteria bacterium RIFCSPHIGHO2_12_FULL_44_11]|uniref:Lon protease n=1 Tax=Candidatus Woesebacteria bacterium RIFCSPLOWO2_01_FULL_44_14 TaxID=1802525 RepID=A0A1F8C227_9BACT|nr:MAG: endopeptidase La [Candidatus Woesebacteria bacterium RIFCSPHIGHO2_12_FULL_44_11]OGM70312.1 MAG: endopeptidase La [Candidatus Woesebacteria bacterium RIFCSPLOWO2_01_FULL_44_14]